MSCILDIVKLFLKSQPSKVVLCEERGWTSGHTPPWVRLLLRAEVGDERAPGRRTQLTPVSPGRSSGRRSKAVTEFGNQKSLV